MYCIEIGHQSAVAFDLTFLKEQIRGSMFCSAFNNFLKYYVPAKHTHSERWFD